MNQIEIRENDLMPNCWKRIGVWGHEKPRCPKLEQVIHCRNCDVFIHAGRNLLERDLPDAYREECTEVMSIEKDEDLPGTLSVVVFRIESEWLALSTLVFSEVIKPEKIHSFPHHRNAVLKGIMNVHGEIQLCISLRDLLGLSPESNSKKAMKIQDYMMVVNSENGQWVFPVDEIDGIKRFHPSTLKNVPVTVARAQATYTKGILNIRGRQVAFLDDELLFYSLKRSVQ